MATMSRSTEEFHSRKTKLSRFLGPYEKWIIKLQDCFSWDSPIIAISVMCVIQYIFWSISVYGLRLFFVIPSVVFLILIVDTWRNQIWPEIRLPPPFEEDEEDWTPMHPKALSVPEISWHIAKVWCWSTKKVACLKSKRTESPLIFVLSGTLIFSTIGILGWYVSGLMLAYLCVMSLYMWSAVQYFSVDEIAITKLRLLKNKIVDTLPPFIQRMIHGELSHMNRSGFDDFLPAENLAARCALNEALCEDDPETRESEERMLPVSRSLDSSLELDISERSAINLTLQESVITHGLPTSFPEHDDLTDDELEKNCPDIPDDSTSDIEAAEDSNDIQFMPTHFNGTDTDKINYNIASVLASGIQTIGGQIARVAGNAAMGVYSQATVSGEGDGGEIEPDHDDFVFVNPPRD